MMNQLHAHSDLISTSSNREKLRENKNLLTWYKSLYIEMFKNVENINHLKILEIGSGTSPLKEILPNVITSDILELDYLDLIFDCHEIHLLNHIPNHSLDLITLTNVLHHLQNPILFLENAYSKLAPNGQIIMAEPYFSALSYPIYKFIHIEPVDFSISEPILTKIKGPLSSSNQAIPYMIFFTKRNWLKQLEKKYDLNSLGLSFHTSLSYFLTGGISNNYGISRWLYKKIFAFDLIISKYFPKIFASFFIVRITTRYKNEN